MLRDYGFVLLAIFIGLGSWALFMAFVAMFNDLTRFGALTHPFYNYFIPVFALIFTVGLFMALLVSPVMLGALYALRGLGWVNPYAFILVGTFFAFLLSFFVPGDKSSLLDYLLWASIWPSGALAGWVLFRLVAK